MRHARRPLLCQPVAHTQTDHRSISLRNDGEAQSTVETHDGRGGRVIKRGQLLRGGNGDEEKESKHDDLGSMTGPRTDNAAWRGASIAEKAQEDRCDTPSSAVVEQTPTP